MPLVIPRLDDRRFDDLVEDLVRRIPAHTPEWTHPRQGDPGVTLIELFAWLADTILYRANLIPERQRLAFLTLLGMPLRAAQAAKGMVALTIEETAAPQLRPLAAVSGPVNFETLGEVTVFPCAGECYYKRVLSDKEKSDMEKLLGGLRDLYSLDGETEPYVTTRLFDGSAGQFDLASQTIDQSLWIALIANKNTSIVRARELLAGKLLNVGFVPAIALAEPLEPVSARARLPFVFELTYLQADTGSTQYLPLDVVQDSTQGLRQQGVIRLALPEKDRMDAPTNDVRVQLLAGVGEEPPRIDDPERQNKLVTWLRIRPETKLAALRMAWIGLHAVEIDQMKTVRARVVGVSNGSPNQRMSLGETSVDASTLDLQVEETGAGWRSWAATEDLAEGGRDTAAFWLDSEAGTVSFGDGLRGRIPPVGSRVRVNFMRAGGGAGGNLPPLALEKISAADVTGAAVQNTLKVLQPVATTGGAEAETLAQAEQRLPAYLRHQNRAVTELDIRQLAAETPGQTVGRVELLPMFVPQQRRFQVPGVVTVMTLPWKAGWQNPNPRADRPFLEAIDAWLRPRKPLATELYVIGCEYVALGIAVGVTVRDGFGEDETLNAVREALRVELWPLAPGGPLRAGWPLGRSVRAVELEVAVSRVPGVETVEGIQLFAEQNHDWGAIAQLNLDPWQLPELLAIAARADGTVPENLSSSPNPFASGPTFGVPVVPETC